MAKTDNIVDSYVYRDPDRRPDHVPEINIYGPIPKWYFRHMPRWVYWLQFVGYALMVPWALALLWIMWLWPLAQRVGLMECFHGPC